MTASNLGALYIPIPGTELTAVVSALRAAFPSLGLQDAGNMVGKILDAYPGASKERGEPYTKGSNAGEWIASRIAQDTGIAAGWVRGTLNALQALAAQGKISAATYNPGKFSVAAKVTAAIKSAGKSAISGVKAGIKAGTPEPVQDLASGLAKGVSGLGDVLQLLPLLTVVGLGVWAYSTTKKGRR